jgi:hypothetical protein
MPSAETLGRSGIATVAPTAGPAAASTETWAGPAWSTRIAINGNASNASQAPNVLIANAAHSRPNDRPSDRRSRLPPSLPATRTPRGR